ncbi:hypothetical protein BS17DRAFT_786780 [Gyrodon lividus]|nr:hypothetical protein BS17DRAFT_786780 [Gyrodon lividus]
MGNSDSSRAMQTPSPFINADLVDHILTSLPDFTTLTSTIVICRAVHNVYRAHPNSVQRAVAYNLVGETLPDAVRYVRCKRDGMTLKPANELFGEDEFAKNPTLLKEEINHLITISKHGKELEALFSWREKDCRFQSSRLSAVESCRFHRALYRLSLYSSTYGQDAYPNEDFVEDAEDIDPAIDGKLSEALQLREKFFDTFSTPELREIQRLTEFLHEIITWSKSAYTSHIDVLSPSYLLFRGPPAEVVLKVYRGYITWELTDDMPDISMDAVWNEFVIPPLSAVLQKRMAPRLSDDQMKLTILDEILGGETNCTQCQMGPMARRQLWSPSTWDFFRGTLPSSGVSLELKGNLPWNMSHRAEFNNLWKNNTYSELISQVFDYKKDEYASWASDDPLCTWCLKRFLREHMHLWFVGEKRKRGEVIPEECWYGYNCRTQRHNHIHAAKLNHYCEPSMGDLA